MIILLLLLSVAAYVAVTLGMGYLGKKTLKTTADMMYFQLVRNIGCVICMAIIAGTFAASKLTVLLGAAMGLAALISSVGNLLAFKYGPVSVSVLIVSSLAMLLASLAGPIFWHESVSTLQIIGMGLCILSMLLLTEKSVVKKASFAWILALLAGGFGGGVQGPIQKVLATSDCAGENLAFVLYTFIFCTLASLIVLLLVRRGGDAEKKQPLFSLKGRILLLVLSQTVLSVFLNINNLHLVAELPTVIFFPSYSIGGLLLTSVASCLLFKEKLSKRQLIGFGVGLAALLLISGVLG